MAVLEVKELTKKYGEGESEVIALDHVSFSVERGECLLLNELRSALEESFQ